MPVQFLADANLDRNIVDGVLRRESAIRFDHAGSALRPRMQDPEVLAIAASRQCLLVSHDVRTMPRHFSEFIAERDSPGVILVPSTVAAGQAIEEIVIIWHTTEPSEWTNRLLWLPI